MNVCCVPHASWAVFSFVIAASEIYKTQGHSRHWMWNVNSRSTCDRPHGMPVKAGLEKLGLESDDVLCVNASRRGVVCKCVEKRSTFAFTTLLIR
jgi:hypothetical protein